MRIQLQVPHAGWLRGPVRASQEQVPPLSPGTEPTVLRTFSHFDPVICFILSGFI